VGDFAPEQLRGRRERARLSLYDLASLLGVSEGLVRHWESGRKAIPPARLGELRQVLAVQAPAAIPAVSGRQLRATREKAGVTQGALAQMLGVKQQAIAAWETGTVPEERREVLVRAAIDPYGFVPGLLRAARERAGLKQTELADALAVKQSRVSGWERGQLPIPGERWPAIRDALATGAPVPPQQPVTAHELLESRRRLGWSQARLAEELGVTTSVVGNWEAGARRPVPRERWRRIREVLRLSAPEPHEPRDRIGEAQAGVLEVLATRPGLNRRELARAVQAPEPYVRAAVLRALAHDLIHERRVKRTRADGIAWSLLGLFPGSPSEQPMAVDLMAELTAKVVAAVKADPGRSRRAIAESLPHERQRGERAVDRAIADGLLHAREVIRRSPSGGARVILGVFPGKSPKPPRSPIDGQKVRRMREQMLIGQAKFARQLGISPGVLRRWERSAVPAIWQEYVEAALFPGEGSREVRTADAKQRARCARASLSARILDAVRRSPGIARWGELARIARPVERPELNPIIERMIAAGKLHEGLSDNGHGTGLFPGPAPAEYTAGMQIDAGQLRALREGAGLGQKELAQRLGAGVASVNAWEQGTRSIPAHRGAQLLELFAGLPQGPCLSGEQLRAERWRLGWTQAELAAHVGVQQATISAWERASPPHSRAGRLCALFERVDRSQGSLFAASPARRVAGERDVSRGDRAGTAPPKRQARLRQTTPQ
jgi:DNA-binding transcriptional regulator YiaG